jgi:hypothetical protein
VKSILKESNRVYVKFKSFLKDNLACINDILPVKDSGDVSKEIKERGNNITL